MKKTIIILAVIAMTALSCSKQENGGEITPPDNGQEIEKIYLKINSASVEQTGEEPTKAAIKETKFPTEQEVSVGLFVVGEGYADAKYVNIKCTKPAGSDKFTDPKIELIEGKTATVYAYYPYEDGISNVEQIPVASSVGGDDWMWATPIEDVSTEKAAIDLRLNHALALVEITFNVVGPAGGTMTNVTVAGGEGAFSKAGTMDATDGGALTPDTGQMATKTSPFSQDVNLTMTDGKIIADCLLVPVKTGTDADVRQDFYIKCTYNGKTLSASLTGDNGVIVRKNTKSTVSLNIKDNKLEVVSVGIAPWTDSNVSGNTAILDGHSVTFNCPAGLKYDIYTESKSTAIPGETTDAEKPTVIFCYDKGTVPDYRFVFNGSISGCTFVHDELSGIITVKDVTKDVTVNLGFGTYIKYTASEKIIPNKTDAFGFPYDETRSTFSDGSGVVSIDGILTAIGEDAFHGTLLTGVIIPEGVTGIGKSAFDFCLQLVSVTLPSTLISIGDNAFWGMGKESVAAKQPLVLPSSLSNIGQYAFEAAKIESVTLPAALKTVGTDAFKSCTIETLTIEDGAVLGKKMFNNCNELKTVTSLGTTPPAAVHDSYYVFAKETDPVTWLGIEHIYVPRSTETVNAYLTAAGWDKYKDKISVIPEQN